MASPTTDTPPSSDLHEPEHRATDDRPAFTPKPKLFWTLLAIYLLWICAMWWMWVATR